MKLDKYNSMPKEDRDLIESLDSMDINNVKIKDPNNPVRLLDAKLLVFKV